MNLQRAKFSRDHIGNRGIFSTYSHPKRKREKNLHTHKDTLTNRELQNGVTKTMAASKRDRHTQNHESYIRRALKHIYRHREKDSVSQHRDSVITDKFLDNQ